MLWKCCARYASKFGKLSSGHRTGKCQFSFQCQRRAMPKDVQTTTNCTHFTYYKSNAQNSPSETSIVREPRNFQMFKMDIEKTEEPEVKWPTSIGSSKKQENSRKTSTSASLTMWKPLSVWITTNCGKFVNRWEFQTTLPVSWETCVQVKKQQLEPDWNNGTMDWFQIRKGVSQGCILSPCLFNWYAEYIMWNARLDQANSGVKDARRHINNLRYAHDTTHMAESEEELKSLLMKVKGESEKADLKLNIQKLWSWHPVPSFHGK